MARSRAAQLGATRLADECLQLQAVVVLLLKGAQAAGAVGRDKPSILGGGIAERAGDALVVAEVGVVHAPWHIYDDEVQLAVSVVEAGRMGSGIWIPLAS